MKKTVTFVALCAVLLVTFAVNGATLNLHKGEINLSLDEVRELLEPAFGSGGEELEPTSISSGATSADPNTTYVTDTTDDFAIGGTDSSAPFFFDTSVPQFNLTGTFQTATITASSINGTIVVDGVAYPQDTQGIQNAVSDACNAGGGKEIYIPSGTYESTASSGPDIDVTCKNIHIKGAGKDKTIIKGAGDRSLIRLDLTGADQDAYFTLSDLTLDASTTDAHFAFETGDTNHVTLKDCRIIGDTETFAVYFAGPSAASNAGVFSGDGPFDKYNTIQNCEIESQFAGDHISWSYQQGSKFINNTVRGRLAMFRDRESITTGNTFYGTSNGSNPIWVSGTAINNVIANNSFHDVSGDAIKITCGDGDTCMGNNIKSNQIFNSSADGIEIGRFGAGDVGTTTANSIINNTIIGSALGIRLNEADGNTVSGNTLINNTASGIKLDLSSDNNILEYNNCYDSQNNPTQDYCITFEGSSLNNKISGNLFNGYEIGTHRDTASSSIYILDTFGTDRQFVISGTSTQDLFEIQDADGTGILGVDTVNTQGTLNANLQITNSDNDEALRVDDSGTQDGILISKAGTLGNGQYALWAVSNTAQTNNTQFVRLELQNGSSDIDLLRLVNAGTAGIALNIDTEATTADAIQVQGEMLTTGDALQLAVDSDVLTTGYAINILGGSSFDTTVFSVDANGNATTTGQLVVGNPTGGGQGTGTINAQGVYDDGVLLTDWLFDLHFDGELRIEDQDKYGDREILTIQETRDFVEKERHLPTIDGRNEWGNGKFSLGKLVTQLWETVEVNAIHIWSLFDKQSELEKRIEKLEQELEDYKKDVSKPLYCPAYKL